MKDIRLVLLIVGFIAACIAVSLLGEWLFPPVPTEAKLVTKCLTAINEGNAACDKGYYSLAQNHYENALDCEETRDLAEAGMEKCNAKTLSTSPTEGEAEYEEDVSLPLPNASEEEEEIFMIVEQMPEFPGGTKALFKFLGRTLKYPPMARENGIEGTVYVSFVVEKDGKIGKVKVKRGLPGGGAGCDDEALKAVKAMPRWKAGRQRGERVRVSYMLPIKFKLE